MSAFKIIPQRHTYLSLPPCFCLTVEPIRWRVFRGRFGDSCIGEHRSDFAFSFLSHSKCPQLRGARPNCLQLLTLFGLDRFESVFLSFRHGPLMGFLSFCIHLSPLVSVILLTLALMSASVGWHLRSARGLRKARRRALCMALIAGVPIRPIVSPSRRHRFTGFVIK